MTTAPDPNFDPSVWSQVGGFLIMIGAIALAFVVMVAAITLIGMLQAAARPRPKPPGVGDVREPRVDCSRSACPFEGRVWRREASTRQFVRVCIGHAAEGDCKGWWTPSTRLQAERDAAEVREAVRAITRDAAS